MGEIIWFQDLRDPLSLSREVGAFHTPQALIEMLNKDEPAAGCWLQENEVSTKYLYPFQIEAIKAIPVLSSEVLIMPVNFSV